MSTSKRFRAERGQNQLDLWYVRDYNVAASEPIVLASTTNEEYAKLIVEALNAQEEKIRGKKAA